MMTLTKEMYSEVYSVLNMLGNAYIAKVPSKLMAYITEVRNKEYNPVYNLEEFEDQKISKNALTFIAILHLNYWCETAEEKAELAQSLTENGKIKEQELLEQYNVDIFRNNKKEKITEPMQSETALTQTPEIKQNDTEKALVEKKESAFTKFINKIKRLFKRK